MCCRDKVARTVQQCVEDVRKVGHIMIQSDVLYIQSRSKYRPLVLDAEPAARALHHSQLVCEKMSLS